MKHRRLVPIGFVLVALAFSLPSSVRGAEKIAETERDLLKLEHDWDKALVQRTPEVLRRILAEDYVLTTPYGQFVTRDQLLESLRTPRPDGFELVAVDHREFSTQLYGDTALLHSRFTLKGRVGTQEVSTPFRHTDVFVKQSGQWRCVSRPATKIATPDGPATIQTALRDRN